MQVPVLNFECEITELFLAFRIQSLSNASSLNLQLIDIQEIASQNWLPTSDPRASRGAWILLRTAKPSSNFKHPLNTILKQKFGNKQVPV